MSTKKKLAIYLLLAGFICALIAFIPLLGSHAFVIHMGTSSIYTNFFRLTFGGAWINSSFPSPLPPYSGNVALIIAFICLLVALIVLALLLYFVYTNKIERRTYYKIGAFTIVLMLVFTIILIFTKQFAINTYIANNPDLTEEEINIIKSNTSDALSVFLSNLFGLFSTCCCIASYVLNIIDFNKTKAIKKKR